MTLYLIKILIFPGLLFLFILSLIGEYYDRKLYARMQNRVGPPWFQPVADFIKLLGKELIIPLNADARIFKILPVFACVATIVAYLYIPLFSKTSLLPFNGDIIFVLYMLTLPTLSYALAGWYSRSPYALIGSTRVLTQLFAYEVPLFMAVLAPAILASSWSFSELITFYQTHNWLWLVNILGFIVAMITLQGKLEKVPFDIPEAETEIVAGVFTEYTGPLYAYFRLAMNMQTIAGASLVAAVFLPFGFGSCLIVNFVIYILKIAFILFLLALMRTLFARLRIDQMLVFCWKYLAPIALAQITLNIIIKAWL
ncbi:MAG: NADH-quinone oxidoreductase subunit H [Endomicrobiaceae bacterium]|jgi:NADH-quinone oxidoreductase subunit H|nr:NADH-quinone oxidoreductase subunit H [Endomicrobiaceae bacterium]MDD4166476.1 NADH-quinone oxidoreductase subunit H [Endomicrobiaceae bacterium]